MRYQPKIGEEFHVISAKTKHLKEFTRSMIALSVVIVCCLALIFATMLGALKGDFGVVLNVWAVVATPLGCVIGFYFRGSILDGKENDESTA